MDKEITGRPAVLKELNIGLLKEALGRCGQATRVGLAETTGISQPTVNMLIRELTADGTVLNLGTAPSTGGRRAEVYALNQKKFGLLLVAVKSGCFELAVTDMELHEEKKDRFARTSDEGCHEQLLRIVNEWLEKNGHIAAISVGVQGAVTGGGEVFAVPSVPEWEQYPLQSVLRERFQIPVRVVNDINAAAAGYQFMHPQTDNMIYLYTDGDGIGAGIVLNKEVYAGSGSFAGELGYMRLGGRSVEELMHTCRNRTEYTALMAQIVMNLICVYNPQKLVLDNNGNAARLLEDLMRECRQKLPPNVIPKTDTARIDEYYFKGLGKLCRELADRDIRVV